MAWSSLFGKHMKILKCTSMGIMLMKKLFFSPMGNSKKVSTKVLKKCKLFLRRSLKIYPWTSFMEESFIFIVIFPKDFSNTKKSWWCPYFWASWSSTKTSLHTPSSNSSRKCSKPMWWEISSSSKANSKIIKIINFISGWVTIAIKSHANLTWN